MLLEKLPFPIFDLVFENFDLSILSKISQIVSPCLIHALFFKNSILLSIVVHIHIVPR
jgi:hypothetical protein